MSEQFKVGEICILQNDPTNTDEGLGRYNGEEVEIVEPLHFDMFDDGTCGFSYGVRVPDGRIIYAFPHELRRRKPPTSGEEAVIGLFKTSNQPTPVPA